VRRQQACLTESPPGSLTLPISFTEEIRTAQKQSRSAGPARCRAVLSALLSPGPQGQLIRHPRPPISRHPTDHDPVMHPAPSVFKVFHVEGNDLMEMHGRFENFLPELPEATRH